MVSDRIKRKKEREDDYKINNKINQAMSQEIDAKDDMLHFAHRLDVDNYNVKRYRKRNTSHTHRKQQKHNRHGDSVDLFQFSQPDHKHDYEPDKTPRTTDIVSSRRFSSTAGVKKRSQRVLDANHLSFLNTGRTKLPSSIVDNPSDYEAEEKELATVRWNQPARVPGKFVQKEREVAKKGQLQNKHFEEWLNHALIESCRDQKFDKTIQYPALKKYGIDKNSLLSKGINPQNLNRIFKSLFVYSMGFNTLLKQMGGSHIQKALWKVYAILLEYCSDGDFETMIGEIERDKVAKMESLRDEIERRQEIIDNNEEIHQEKNARIFKEIKLLRQANHNLENDKQVLMEDYKEAEQAFNEQVALRLKFQSKINQIHGVHHELTIKHQKLYDDLYIKKKENSNLKQKVTDLTNDLISTQNCLEDEKDKNKRISKELEFNSQQTEIFKERDRGHGLKEIEWQHKMDELTAQIHQKGRKVQQISKELQNTELMFKLKDESEKQLQKEYQRALEENKQLVQSLQVQLQELNKYMLEKKEFNDTHSRLHAELAFANKVLVSRQEEIEEGRRVIKEMRYEVETKKTQVEAIQSKNSQLQLDLEDCYCKMEEMKRIKDDVEEEVNELRLKEETYLTYLQEKEKKLTEMVEKVEDLQSRVAEFNITKRTLDSKIALLNQKITSDEEMYKKKVASLEEELAVVERERKSIRQEIEVRRAEASRYMLLYEETMSKVKDHIFERNDLELKYNQSLNVVENETDHIRNLNIRISEMEERNEEISRQLRAGQIVLEGKEKAFKLETAMLNKNIDLLKATVRNKSSFVHPMRYEEALASAINYQHKIEELKNQMARIKAESRQGMLEGKIKLMEKEFEAERLAFSSELQLRETTIAEQKDKHAELKKEFDLRNSQINTETVNESFKAKEMKYLEFIKEKSSKIQQLLQQLQKMQDTNTRMLKDFQQMEKKVKDSEADMARLERERAELMRERRQMEEQRKKMVVEKEKIQVQIEQIARKSSEEKEKEATIQAESRDSNSRQNQRQFMTSKEKERVRRQERAEWRNDFVKKHTNATNYYNK